MTHFAPFHFADGFNIYWYKKHLADYGFEILEIERSGNFFEFAASLLRQMDVVSKRYSKKMNIFDKIVTLLFLKMLSKYSKHDKGSDELLCLGYHVYAEKI
jgi:hypothetical protein